MGRPRKSNPLNLPPRVYAKHGAFYYHHPGGRWEHLGRDLDAVKRRAAEIAHGMGDGYGTVAFYLDEFLAACKRRVTAQDLAQRTLDDYTRARVHLALQLGGVPAPTGSSCSTSPPSLRYGVDALAGQTGGAGGVKRCCQFARSVVSPAEHVGEHHSGAGG